MINRRYNNRRALTEIKVKILECCMFEAKITHIMYKSRTSFILTTKIINELIDKGLIERENDNIDRRTKYTYSTTDKGCKIVYEYKKLVTLI